MTAQNVALVAGFFFLSLAAFTQGVLPMMEPQSRTTRVTAVVRTDLGELKWTHAVATDYTPIERRGRETYIREGCWYCHSQYIRPVTGETRRWGPVTQAGEYAYDLPHLFSTRRIGPDLSRIGLQYSDEWHLAHFWDPRMIAPDSIMPRFARLFDSPSEKVRIVIDEAGQRSLERTSVTQRIFEFSMARIPKAQLLLTPNAEGLLFVGELGKYPIIHTPNREFTGDAVKLVVVTDEIRALIAYLQKLGTNRGKWRDLFEPQLFEVSQVSMTKSDEWTAYGKEEYMRRCAGCHGATGDGNGPAATFMSKARPRDFTRGVFKFRDTPSNSLPTDGDLLRTVTRGVRGTAMPSWHMLSEKTRLAIIQYVKYELAVDHSDSKKPFVHFEEDRPQPAIRIGDPPAPSKEIVTRGAAIWDRAKCWECHGRSGQGDGEKAAGLKDDGKFPIPPANLTAGQFKSGPLVRDIFRTISTGLSGTPMPSYADSFNEEERWALSYYVLSLSAFLDPLTQKPLPMSAEDKAALSDIDLRAASSEKAYRPRTLGVAEDSNFGGNAWAKRRGFDRVAIPAADARASATSTER
ncbi:MAG: cbb3-type cytochrome c oxidase subunit II [Proteobacteria bacterium]|nr:cbb3-type cytochrome c oxidase subunit II [Pseudomonadota bacterium]